MAFAKAVRSGFRRGGTIRNSTCLPRLLLIQLYIIAASHRSLTTRITGKFNRLDCYVQTIMKSPGALAGFFWSVVIIAPRDDSCFNSATTVRSWRPWRQLSCRGRNDAFISATTVSWPTAIVDLMLSSFQKNLQLFVEVRQCKRNELSSDSYARVADSALQRMESIGRPTNPHDNNDVVIMT